MKNLNYIIIATLIGVIIWMRACDTKPIPVEAVVETKTDTVYVTKEVHIPTYIPKIIRKDSIVKVPVDVDTSAVLQDYFAKVHYADTVWLDSIGYVAINDVISKNTIESRDVITSYSYPIITNTTTITLPPERRTQVYGGFSALYPLGFGPQLMLKTRNDAVYQIGMLGQTIPSNSFMFSANFNVLWKIKLRK